MHVKAKQVFDAIDPSFKLIRAVFPQRVLWMSWQPSEENAKDPPANHCGDSSVHIIPLDGSSLVGHRH